jgi:large subunit ribosomal protein L6
VTITIADTVIAVKGPKGEIKFDLVPEIEAVVEDDALVFRRSDETSSVRASHGLMRSLAGNAVKGVTQGFSKRLEVQGIGYKAEVRGNKLMLNLGYSHQIEFAIPQGIQIAVDKDNKITVSGIDKGQVGQVAADIRDLRKPDRYKGKGVRYEGEYINLKAGKSA